MMNTERSISDIINEFTEILDECQTLYNLVYGYLSEQTSQIKIGRLNTGELTDFGFLSKELECLFDELRKECKARKDLCGSMIAYKLIQESLTDPAAAIQSRGSLSIGVPDVKMQVSLPKKFTEEYFQITDHFGVSRDVAATGILRLDWNAVVEYCTKLFSEGKKIPSGFGKKYPLYQTTFRKLAEKSRSERQTNARRLSTSEDQDKDQHSKEVERMEAETGTD
jgi:hypothetical protein